MKPEFFYKKQNRKLMKLLRKLMKKTDEKFWSSWPSIKYTSNRPFMEENWERNAILLASHTMPFCWPLIHFKFESKRIKAPKIFHILLIKIATLIDWFIEKFQLQDQMSTFANRLKLIFIFCHFILIFEEWIGALANKF